MILLGPCGYVIGDDEGILVLSVRPRVGILER